MELATQVALVVKNPPSKAGDRRDVGSILGSGKCPGVGNGNPLLYSSWTEEAGGLPSVGLQRVRMLLKKLSSCTEY